MGARVFDYPVLGSDEDLPSLLAGHDHVLVAVGQIKSPEPRIRLFNLLAHHKCEFPTIVSPRAYVSRHARVAVGTIVMHGAVVNAGATVGRNCILNSQCLVEHDAVIGDHCHISTAAAVNSGVSVGSCTFIGSNTCVRSKGDHHRRALRDRNGAAHTRGLRSGHCDSGGCRKGAFNPLICRAERRRAIGFATLRSRCAWMRLRSEQ